MEITIFRKEEEIKLEDLSNQNSQDPDICIALEQAKKGLELAKKLGFRNQLAMYAKHKEALEKRLSPEPPYPKLSEKEWRQWQRVLPTAYNENYENTIYYDSLTLNGYHYDLIPTRVLAEIEEVREKRYFDRLQIRTRERPRECPGLFGFREVSVYPSQVDVYLVALWAEDKLGSLKKLSILAKIEETIRSIIPTSFEGKRQERP